MTRHQNRGNRRKWKKGRRSFMNVFIGWKKDRKRARLAQVSDWTDPPTGG